MSRRQEIGATVVSMALVASMVTMGVALGSGVAAANHPDDAPDMTEYVDFTVNFPHKTDHYPGSTNEANGSIQYFASGADAFREQGAEEGVWIDWIIVHAEYEGEDWIDYSACSTDNTEAFGIDRGNNNEGTQYDEDLVQKQEKVSFEDDGIVIDFFEFNDFSNDPPYMAPEDAIVAAQGAGSSAGACLTLTDEPGWYRIAAFMNGTVADNGPNKAPSDDAERVSLELHSSPYLYVCECDSRQEAEEKLGQPPGSGDPTPTPTPTPGGGETPTDTPEPTQDPGQTATPEPDTDTPEPTQDPGGGDGTPAATTDGGTNGDGDTGGDGGGGNATPTPGQPGFGAVAAILALLAGALLAYRRS